MAKYTETLAEWLGDGNSLPEEFGRQAGLRESFLARFCDREIGFETPDLFGIKLNLYAELHIDDYLRRVALLADYGTMEDLSEELERKTTTELGATRGTVSELPYDASAAEPSAVNATDEVTNSSTYSGYTPDELSRAVDWLARKRALRDEFLSLFEPLFMEVY